MNPIAEFVKENRKAAGIGLVFVNYDVVNTIMNYRISLFIDKIQMISSHTKITFVFTIPVAFI